MLVFPRVKLRNHMMKGAPPDSIGVANLSGWMSAACLTEFIKHFIKHTKCSKDRPVILILDNHNSHISLETIDLSKENGVTLLTLPPHCSHKLQPLDRSVYGPFKTFYNQAANAFIVSHPGKTITIYDLAELVGKADEQALTPRTIKICCQWLPCRLIEMYLEKMNFCPHMSRTGPTVAPMIAIQPLRQKTY